MTTPLATYRVQLHAGFGFDAVAAIAPYLSKLGVSHVYCSPYLQAAPGSTHGYDVVDHTRLNDELGGAEAFERMCDALAAHGLSHIVDIVPNHMSTRPARLNAWWWDVLENGPSSRWAGYFDIDWSPPGKVLLPVLGDHYGRVLDAGEVRIERDGGSLIVRYHEHEAPLSPRTLDELLGAAAADCESAELASIAVALGRLPHSSATDPDSVEERHRDKEVLRASLERLLEEDPSAADAVARQVAAVNRDPDRLDALLLRQNHRLAFWRTAGEELDYRRFFDIPELVALRMEKLRVFGDVHRLVSALVAEGKVDGLRVDHPDGLRDPAWYLHRLREAAGPDAYIVVEKIVHPEEALPAAWPVAGTTGYDFMNAATGLFIDPGGEQALTELYARFTGAEPDFASVAYDARKLVMQEALTADLNRLTTLALTVCERQRHYRDYTRRDLNHALAEIAACFPVYRTYVRPGDQPDEANRGPVERAVAEAARRAPDLEPDLLDFLRDVLLGRLPGEPEADLALRFQQFTCPVIAKGIEDTAFYRYLRLVGLNDVGGDPGRFGTTPEAFHRHNATMAEAWPATMLTTSTHDTKRAEDVRARLALLSEIPEQWALAVRRWAARTDERRHGRWPDADTEYLVYQTLVGAWPIDTERAVAYVLKAVKEAKRHTSWIGPDPAYEEAIAAFVAETLADDELVADLEGFVRPLVDAGRTASLAQLLLKFTSPGVPDTYQGTELWDLSLVDPDNRRPVDFDLRARLLDKVAEASAAEVLEWADDGAPKLWLIQRALRARRHPGQVATALARGASYRPLAADGEKADHAVAYLRGDDALVVVPRLVLGLGGDWGDTSLVLPPGRWTDQLGGERSWEGGVPVAVADLLAGFPVALLGRA